MALASADIMAEWASPSRCHQCLHSQVKSQVPPASQEALQEQQVGLTQAFFKLQPLHMLFKSSLIPKFSDSPEHKPHWLSKQKFWGLIFLLQCPRLQSSVGFRPLAPWGGPL